jgi:hypothetical protein
MVSKVTRTFGWLVVAWSTIAASTALARDKTDIILLRNGDRLTGEIVSLEYGLLRLSTDDIGTVSVEWNAIASIDSGYTFDVERAGGRRYYGLIGTSEDGENLVVRDEGFEQSLPLATVVRITGVEPGFWERVSGTLSLGYNYTKSSGIRTSNLNVSSAFQSERLKATLNISALESGSDETESTGREQVSSTVEFRGERPGFWMLFNSLERNEELGIERRLQTGGGVGRYFRQDADSELLAAIGVINNQEKTVGEDTSQQSIEGIITTDWRIFRFDDPETSLHATATLYPSITESGRLRGNLDISLRRELISDLFFDISLYESYDSNPPADSANVGPDGPEKTDYGIVTSIGYKF